MRAGCALLLLAIASPARAGVVVGAGVPFTADELSYALAARRPAAVATAFEVRLVAPARLQVVSDGGRWDVEVGDAQGAAAARLVALNVLGAAEGVEEPVAARPATRRRPVRVTAVAGAGRGVGKDDLPAVTAALEAATGRRWWLGAGFEWQESLAAPAGEAAPVDAQAWLVRVVVGRSLGPVELSAGPLVGRVALDADGATSSGQTGVSFRARAGWPLAPRWTLMLGAAADGYRRSVELRRDGALVASTPRVSIGATVGLRWELGP